MSGARRALVGAVGLGIVAVAVGLAWRAAPRSVDLTGADLDVDAEPGRAAPEDGPVVPRLAPGDAARLHATLCPPEGDALAGAVPAAWWVAPGRGEWRRVQQDWTWAPAEEGCVAAALEGPVAALWPETTRGVVRWAVVVGAGAAEPPPAEGPTWRQRGLLVVDGEIVVTGP